MTKVGIRLAAVLLVGIVVTSCGGDDGAGEGVGVRASAGDGSDELADYAVYGGDAWSVVDAATDVPDPPVALLRNGDWRAEYVRSVDAGDSVDVDEVTVGGYRVDIGAAEDELGRSGPVEFSSADLSPWHGVVGSFAGDDEGPRMVLLDVDSTTVAALTYDLSEPELVEWVRSLDPSTQEQWLAHVGLG